MERAPLGDMGTCASAADALAVTLSDGRILPSLPGEQSEGGREGGRVENNLDSDYQPASTQEGGNVSMATETTSQCHVTTTAAVSRQMTSGSGRRVAPARRAAGAQSRANLCGGTPGLRLGERLTRLRAATFDLISNSNTSSESDRDAGQEISPAEAKCVRNGGGKKLE